MITKAIVEQIVDKYNIRVRVPTLDRISASNVRTPTNELDIAVICTLPNCHPNLRVGDIVIVSIDESETDTIILGQLYTDKTSNTLSDMELASLHIWHEANLPYETTIGEVTPENLNCLAGAKENLQQQIDELKLLVKQLTQGE